MARTVLITLVLFAALAAGVAQQTIPARQESVIARTVQSWTDGLSTYIAQNCSTGLSDQTSTTLAATLPASFRTYGLLWTYFHATGVTQVTIDPAGVSNFAIPPSRALGLVAIATRGQMVAGIVSFVHTNNTAVTLAGLSPIPLLSYHGFTGKCL